MDSNMLTLLTVKQGISKSAGRLSFSNSRLNQYMLKRTDDKSEMPTRTMPTYVPLSQTLPPTPELPAARDSGTVQVSNGARLWYGLYGPEFSELSPSPDPVVVFLHGGKISSRWWGHQITYLAGRGHSAVAIDTRGHGRSSDSTLDKEAENADSTSLSKLTYELLASDVAVVLNQLGIPRAAVVGWSDGANTALALAMTEPELVDRAFVFGANYAPDQANLDGIRAIPFLDELQGRMRAEYKEISPTPGGFDEVYTRVSNMQSHEPRWQPADFKHIPTLFDRPVTAPIVWIVTGDSEEMIEQRVPGEMRDMIPGASLVVLPDVGHFAPLQDPDTINVLLKQWLTRRRHD